jgi:hypothetical protein
VRHAKVRRGVVAVADDRQPIGADGDRRTDADEVVGVDGATDGCNRTCSSTTDVCSLLGRDDDARARWERVRAQGGLPPNLAGLLALSEATVLAQRGDAAAARRLSSSIPTAGGSALGGALATVRPRLRGAVRRRPLPGGAARGGSTGVAAGEGLSGFELIQHDDGATTLLRPDRTALDAAPRLHVLSTQIGAALEKLDDIPAWDGTPFDVVYARDVLYAPRTP